VVAFYGFDGYLELKRHLYVTRVRFNKGFGNNWKEEPTIRVPNGLTIPSAVLKSQMTQADNFNIEVRVYIDYMIALLKCSKDPENTRIVEENLALLIGLNSASCDRIDAYIKNRKDGPINVADNRALFNWYIEYTKAVQRLKNEMDDNVVKGIRKNIWYEENKAIWYANESPLKKMVLRDKVKFDRYCKAEDEKCSKIIKALIEKQEKGS
jgi:hypothetical protein